MSHPEELRPNHEAFKLVMMTLLFRQLTVLEIAAETTLSTPFVEKMLAKCIARGQVTRKGDHFSLSREMQERVVAMKNMEMDTRLYKKFEKYRANELHEASIHHGEKFTIDTVEPEAGTFQFVRTLSPHEEAYCFENQAFFVWREGPRAGEPYYRVPKMNEKDVITTDPNSFRDQLNNYLLELSHTHSPDTLGQLHTYILAVCYGHDGILGWEKARLYDLGEKGHEINQYMRTMMEQGLAEFLAGYAASLNLTLSPLNLVIQRKEEYRIYFDGMSENDWETNRWQGDDALMLNHGTFSHILPNLLQMGGLASRDYYRSFGIQKYYGGESHGSDANTPYAVSFFYQEDGRPIIRGGYSSQRAFDFPVRIGISQEKAEQLNLRPGPMKTKGELVVPNFVPLSFITHMFVPSFKIHEVTSLLEQNEVTHIQILPLRQ